MENVIESKAWFEGIWRAVRNNADGSKDDLGIISREKLTTPGARWLVDVLASDFTVAPAAAFGDPKYIAIGTSTLAFDRADTTLGTEVDLAFTSPLSIARTVATSKTGSTQVNDGRLRVVGTTGAFTAAGTINEVGLLTGANKNIAVGNLNRLIDRAVGATFTPVAVGIGDTVTFTYDLSMVTVA